MATKKKTTKKTLVPEERIVCGPLNDETWAQFMLASKYRPTEATKAKMRKAFALAHRLYPKKKVWAKESPVPARKLSAKNMRIWEAERCSISLLRPWDGGESAARRLGLSEEGSWEVMAIGPSWDEVMKNLKAKAKREKDEE